MYSSSSVVCDEKERERYFSFVCDDDAIASLEMFGGFYTRAKLLCISILCLLHGKTYYFV